MQLVIITLQQSRSEDYFLVRQSRSAIVKLLERKLRIKIRNENVNLTLKMDVASYKPGQINPVKVFQKAINRRYNSLITLEGISNILDLDAFSETPDFLNFEADLNNGAAFNLLCNTLDKKLAGGDVNVTHINGVRFTNNKLYHIPCFDVDNLQKIRMQMFDFRNNNVSCRIVKFFYISNYRTAFLDSHHRNISRIEEIYIYRFVYQRQSGHTNCALYY